MGRTIVQEYGPIYGEPVNGTVQGRPNGSVYVPSTNTVSVSLIEDYRYFVLLSASTVRCVDSTGTTGAGIVGENPLYSANAQDLSSNIQIQLYSDEELTNLIAYRNLNAGIFNGRYGDIYNADVTGLSDGDTLYLRAQLLNNGVPVATSNVIPVSYVVVS